MTTIATSPKVTNLITNPIPDRLWHYTSFAGLKGIVDSRSIFVSDIRFLNDSAELIHARSLLSEIAEYEMQQLIGPDPLDELSARIEEMLKAEVRWIFEAGPLHSSMLQFFVACFLEAKDQLSQWRGYSQGTSGVSIGFDLRGVRSTLFRQLAVFAPCIYEDHEKRELLQDVVKDLFRRSADLIRLAWSAGKEAGLSGKLKDFDEWYRDNPDRLELSKQVAKNRMSAVYDLLHVAALMKHSSFREEREWRLTMPLLKAFNDQDFSMFFGTNNCSMIPRTAYTFDWQVTPIKELILGPGTHDAAKEALKLYMDSSNIEPEISNSGSPYRLLQ